MLNILMVLSVSALFDDHWGPLATDRKHVLKDELPRLKSY